MPVVRPPGEGRKARARQRRAQAGGDLLNAPFLHGNTVAGRWQQLDSVLVEILPREGLAVDIGMGEIPATTLEFASIMGDGWEVIGTECHLDRLKRAKLLNYMPNVNMIATGLDFTLPFPRPTIIRALNVFRDYCLQDALKSMLKLCSQLPEGGVFVEGSASKNGDIWSVLCANNRGIIDMVLFGTSKEEIKIDQIESCLPRIWRNECLDMPHAEPVRHFLDTWRDQKHMPFKQSIHDLEKKLNSVNSSWAHLGVLVWNPSTPIIIPRIGETFMSIKY